MSRLLALLRSRRLAIWLLLACVAWAVVGSAIPQLSRDGAAEVAVWRAAHPVLAVPAGLLGLHAAWTAPVFLLAMILLAASTAACAFERTRWALRTMRAGATITPARATRLETSPALQIRSELDQEETRQVAATLLRRWGYRVEPLDASRIAGMKGRYGPLGSSVFHWALTLLFVVVTLGHLTRSEGLMGVPVGGGLPNNAEEYGRLERGPLYPDRYADVAIEVPVMASGQVKDGVTIGSIPRVRIVANGVSVAEQDVYANSPLRYGSLMVHLNGEGLVAFAEMTGHDGAPAEVRRVYFDADPARASGFSEARLTYTVEGRRVDVVLEPAPRASEGQTPQVKITHGESGRTASGTVVAVGTPVSTAAGMLVVRDPGVYARLSVVDDASVYPIYALFSIGLAGLGVAIFSPRRSVWCQALSADGDVRLHVVTDGGERDAALLSELQDELLQAMGTSVQPQEGV